MSLKTILRLRELARSRVLNFTPVAIRSFSENKSGDQQQRWRRNWKITGSVLLGSVLIGSAITDKLDVKQKLKKSKKEATDVACEAGVKRPDLPTFRADEVSKHDSKKSFWVTYKHGVYDVTKFLPSHPGGEQILNAAGLSIEPFWNVYGMHLTPEVFGLLETYRIGVYDLQDRIGVYDATKFLSSHPGGEQILNAAGLSIELSGMSTFLSSHPGGEQILNAAGLSIEPFWNVYGMHLTPEVFGLLETYRIGNLHDDDVVDHSDDELWVREPYRDNGYSVCVIVKDRGVRTKDFTLEDLNKFKHVTLRAALICYSIRVIVKDHGVRTKDFTLEDLNKFKHVTLRAALMCAGNRRSEMNEQVKPVKGISWAGGAVSNARWGGVLLRDVLVHCGVDLENTEGKHVIFTGSDIDATGVNFSTSIPLSMAADPTSRILLATTMNGAALPPDHGYPLRVVVPGAPAVRSVKWLESITISEDESPSHWHQKDYRAFNPSKTWETADFATAPPVYSLPVTSAFCRPQSGDTVPVCSGHVVATDHHHVAPPVYSLPVTSAFCRPQSDDTVPVCSGHVVATGYAYSGGGAKILRVDVSADQGKTWIEAEPTAVDPAPHKQHYSWMLWKANIPVDKGQKEVELWVKATDSNFNTQPEKFHDIWNIRGILSNAYHKIRVKVQHQ
ncbi:sulfite oxidase [Ostrinia nubilalis]|uniref:sulfite oxidase n=1 Tax=Ostrinia nubilalis TaxID=29057 RepID=UPI0030824C49